MAAKSKIRFPEQFMFLPDDAVLTTKDLISSLCVRQATISDAEKFGRLPKHDYDGMMVRRKHNKLYGWKVGTLKKFFGVTKDG